MTGNTTSLSLNMDLQLKDSSYCKQLLPGGKAMSTSSPTNSNVFMFSASSKAPYTIATMVRSEKPNTVAPKHLPFVSSF